MPSPGAEGGIGEASRGSIGEGLLHSRISVWFKDTNGTFQDCGVNQRPDCRLRSFSSSVLSAAREIVIGESAPNLLKETPLLTIAATYAAMNHEKSA